MYYKKYRPDSFSGIKGQNFHVKSILKAIETNTIPNEMLLYGETGTGKTTFGRLVAKYLNCENPKKDGPCNECTQCKDVDTETWSLGTKYLHGSKSNIDDMRDIEDYIHTVSYTSENKIVFIDEIQELRPEAIKVLLGLMEEELDDVYFIILAMDINKVPNAVVNRCEKFKFKLVPYEDIFGIMVDVAQKENIKLTEEKEEVLVELADSVNGVVREALTTCDKLFRLNDWNIKDLYDNENIISSKFTSQIISDIHSGKIDFLQEISPDVDLLNKMVHILSLLLKGHFGGLKKYEKFKVKNLNMTEDQVIDMFQRFKKIYDVKFPSPPIVELGLLEIAMHYKNNPPEQPKRRKK